MHWFAGYELVSTYVSPHPGSRWAKTPDALDLTQPPSKLETMTGFRTRFR